MPVGGEELILRQGFGKGRGQIEAFDCGIDVLTERALGFHPEHLLHGVRLFGDPARPLSTTKCAWRWSVSLCSAAT